MKKLEGQTAWVTGASRGIGRAIARRLAEDGAKVIGTATSQAGADGITAALAEFGGQGAVLDVREPEAAEALLKAAGAPTILVNNAGVTRDQLLMRMKDEDWDAVIATDLTSVFRLTRAVLKSMMKARHGRIISIGSVVGTRGNPGQTNYCAAKAGLVGFSKSLAQEIGSRGITVNVVAPGFIATDMTDALAEATRESLLSAVPLGRLGAPEDIANAVAFLASTEAGYITGETLHINGGLHMA
ncbi:3-oxoacyl-ACP reductase FabG [Polycyclovorans algicola]|uniref:3-oxoacyl-ACP reductase FabG n=1 Tax=Polycyclovorans algicola TaxID=616992 RepID=UPI0004A6C5E8|nr:3-oxoacyl-ACP reductase FabG [Polycyclovorans algicola]